MSDVKPHVLPATATPPPKRWKHLLESRSAGERWCFTCGRHHHVPRGPVLSCATYPTREIAEQKRIDFAVFGDDPKCVDIVPVDENGKPL